MNFDYSSVFDIPDGTELVSVLCTTMSAHLSSFLQLASASVCPSGQSISAAASALQAQKFLFYINGKKAVRMTLVLRFPAGSNSLSCPGYIRFMA